MDSARSAIKVFFAYCAVISSGIVWKPLAIRSEGGHASTLVPYASRIEPIRTDRSHVLALSRVELPESIEIIRSATGKRLPQQRRSPERIRTTATKHRTRAVNGSNSGLHRSGLLLVPLSTQTGHCDEFRCPQVDHAYRTKGTRGGPPKIARGSDKVLMKIASHQNFSV
jgi:hypothetical protein